MREPSGSFYLLFLKVYNTNQILSDFKNNNYENLEEN
jgi:hypothetical protein